MKTELAFDMMTTILPDVAEIVNDPKLAQAKTQARAQGKSFKQAMTELLPLFLQDHRESVLRIFAAVQGKTVEDVKEQPFRQTTIETVAEVMEEVMLFFGYGDRPEGPISDSQRLRWRSVHPARPCAASGAESVCVWRCTRDPLAPAVPLSPAPRHSPRRGFRPAGR